MTNKEIINLRVETKGGQSLGRVIGFEVEPTNQTIVNYYVKSKNIIEGLFKNELIVNRSQVVGLTKEKMVVEDGVVEIGAKGDIRLSPKAA